MNPRPLYTAAEAVAIAISELGTRTYRLGTGDCDTPPGAPSDCVWAIVRCYGIRRHRPGFNRGADNARGDVEDDINCNSAIDDGFHTRDLFVAVETLAAPEAIPQPGDVLAYPTIRLPGHPNPWIGHVCIVESADRLLAWIAAGNVWSWHAPRWDLLDVIHCHAGNGAGGHAIDRATGAIWCGHDANWTKDEHRSILLRVVVP